MKNENLKDCLDDALSGIGENPWLLRQVLHRAESEESKPVKKKISFGTVLIIALILVLTSVGIAAVTQWNVLDFMKQWGKEASYITTEVRQTAETENARLSVESVVYDGETLAFDVTLENKHPETIMWSDMEEFTVNGRICEPAVIYDGEEESDALATESLSGIQNQWLPGWMHPDGITRDGELIRLPGDAAGQETVRVKMKVNVYRPVRPVTLIDDSREGFRAELEQKIAEGYYVIPQFTWDHETFWPTDGFFVQEDDPEACPEAWSVMVGGAPPTDLMGGMTVETLEICFEAHKTALTEGIVAFRTEERYENEYCTAVFEQAEVSELGLRLTLRVNPKNELGREPRIITLSDGGSFSLNGQLRYPGSREVMPSPDHPGEILWRLEWPNIRPEDLPDAFSMRCMMKDGENIFFPLKKP